MQRCLQLAALGAGHVAPNPLVGAVLVYQDRIIGEGWHRQYGGPHAEVNCINSVQEADRPLISQSTLYVSLEPCNHKGKTPPCTDLVLHHNIPRVVVGCTDPFAKVNGAGIARLKELGVEIITGVLEAACIALNRRFFTFHQKSRPYIVLKWAQTADGKMGSGTNERLLISNELTNRLVHRWRSEEAGILVGSRTALLDNPQLDNRLWSGPPPTRIVIDQELQLPIHLQVFNGRQPTIVLNTREHKEENGTRYQLLATGVPFVQSVLQALHACDIQSVLVEGGATLLRLFIESGLWDEARIITNTQLQAPGALEAPLLQGAVQTGETIILNDRVTVYSNPQTNGL